MANIDQLKNDIMNVIKDDNYDIEDLRVILKDILLYIDNPMFKQNLDIVVGIIMKDRDGNNKFEINDLNIMSKDLITMTSLITALLLLILSIPGIKFEYKSEVTETIIFKLIAYIFLVIVPKETNKKLTLEEKQTIVDLILLSYQMILSSQVTAGLVAKVKAWIKQNKKFSCKCLGGDKVLDKKLSKVNKDLLCAINNVREKSELDKK